MDTNALLTKGLELSRNRTLELLGKVEKLPDPQAALLWRPGPGRAHIGWQIVHIAITEEVFAIERLAPQKQAAYAGLWPRFRAGSTPDDNELPSPAAIREILAGTRQCLLDSLQQYGLERLDEVPPPLKQRGTTVRDVYFVLAWHEAHHQGQAHLTLNLLKNRQ